MIDKVWYHHEMTLTINEVVELVPAWQGKEVSIEPLSGGLTNSNFKIVVDGSLFFVSLSGRHSELLGIDWTNKHYNARICGEAGLSPKVVQHFPEQRVLILEFLPLPLGSAESLRVIAGQRRLVHTLKRLHSGPGFWQEFDMFGLIEFYVATIQERGFELPGDYAAYRERIEKIGAALAPYREQLVPCHNDLVPENIMDDGNQVFLLDFDYSGNNDPCFDLGSISVEVGYDDAQVRELAKAYYGFVSEQIIARIHLHGILGDVGWSLWSVIQAEISDIDFDFPGYGLKRWDRAGEKMASRDFAGWLRHVRSKKVQE
ncbi:MAG: phosphotransferase [Chloroflexi bacterium]|nr:phosphotransferase [Chloroflexota bacterium]